MELKIRVGSISKIIIELLVLMHLCYFLMVFRGTRLFADSFVPKTRMVPVSYTHLTIIDTYLRNVQEVYQLADVYLFPVQEIENCIDIPLSVLEAASCNLPIVTTEYGELASFIGQEGFLFTADLSSNSLNEALETICLLYTSRCV